MDVASSSSAAATRVPPTQGLQIATDEFQRILTGDQRAELRELQSTPDAAAVLVFTAQLDRFSTRRRSANMGTRLISVLQFVRESSIIIDTFVSSRPEIAALVWGSVKLTMQVVLNFTSYYERISDLFMHLAKECPRFADYQALFPSSDGLQKAICDFNASIIYCCKHVVEAVQRPWQTQLRNAFWQSFQQEFKPDLEKIQICSCDVRQEIKLAKAKADRQDQTLQEMERKLASKERSKVRQIFSRVEGNLKTIKEEQLQQGVRQTEENRRRLLDSLSSYDYLTPYKKACKTRHSGTAEWLFQSTAFIQWEEGSASPWLWCSGKIGSGKTILTASVIEHTYAHERRAGEIVTFFFPQFDDPASLSAETTLRSIIRQSLDPVRLPSKVEVSLADISRKPSSELVELTSLLRQTIEQSHRFYVFIDALDEFEPAERRALLNSLVSVVTRSRLRVFISGRESLSDELRDKIPTMGAVSMASTSAESDITTFVEETLQERQRNGDLAVEDQSIFDGVKEALISRADGMFLWVTFLIDEICVQYCQEDIQEAINHLPKNLTETFSRALQRISDRNRSSIAKQAFQWIATAKRRLTLDELRDAMSVEIGQSGSRPERRIIGIHRLPSWCENLVRIDEELKTVEFAHKAIYRFIVEGLSGPHFTDFHFDPDDADHNAGEICVTYLGFSDFVTTISRRPQPVNADPTGMAYSALKNSWKLPKSINNALVKKHKEVRTESDLVQMLAVYNRPNYAEDMNKLQDRYPFLKYASVHWISHTTQFMRGTSLTWSTWRRFFTPEHDLAKMPWSTQQDPEIFNDRIFSWSVEHRHFAVLRLLGSIDRTNGTDKTKAMTDSAAEADMDLLDAVLESGCTNKEISLALQAASGPGHIEVVKKLLDAGADANVSPSLGSQTALQAASVGGHIEIVQQLLTAGADVNANPSNGAGWTALQTFSASGHIEIVERLLALGAIVNASPASYDGRTALQAASEGGHVKVVKRLLVAGANVNARPSSGDGRTALQAASEGGHIEIVDRLLIAGANVNTRPSGVSGRTALYAASEGGHFEVVERLLSAGANVDTSHPGWNSPLEAASGGGHIKVVEQLLIAGANPNARAHGRSGQTALEAASHGGHVEVVVLLRRAGAKK